jgi:hypothetical protein
MNAPQDLSDLARTAPRSTRPSAYSLVLNVLPLALVAAGAAAVWLTEGATARIAVALAWIYLLPPLAARAVTAAFGAAEGDNLTQDSRAYRVWWLLVQLQVIFNRFPFFEEVLRLAPGAYALWLNLWGSKVSLVVYWGPGALAADRQALRIGPGAVIGTRSVLSGHLALKNESGEFRVTLAPVEIGAGALIGAYAGIGPGCRIEAGEEVPAAAFLRPHTRWSEGSRIKPARPRSAG